MGLLHGLINFTLLTCPCKSATLPNYSLLNLSWNILIWISGNVHWQGIFLLKTESTKQKCQWRHKLLEKVYKIQCRLPPNQPGDQFLRIFYLVPLNVHKKTLLSHCSGFLFLLNMAPNDYCNKYGFFSSKVVLCTMDTLCVLF